MVLTGCFEILGIVWTDLDEKGERLGLEGSFLEECEGVEIGGRERGESSF